MFGGGFGKSDRGGAGGCVCSRVFTTSKGVTTGMLSILCEFGRLRDHHSLVRAVTVEPVAAAMSFASNSCILTEQIDARLRQWHKERERLLSGLWWVG